MFVDLSIYLLMQYVGMADSMSASRLGVWWHMEELEVVGELSRTYLGNLRLYAICARIMQCAVWCRQ